LWRHEHLRPDLDLSTPADHTEFAHSSERQFARLLDFYGIEWAYEPRSFPIEFGEDAGPIGYFTPDFYLPDEDLFIEITTMSQKLVTKKNRKVRLLREHHPGVRCKIFYQRDYLHLLIKYGITPDPDRQITAPTRIPGPPQIVNLGDVEESA
jgi:hypoxanthine phosphoribosyltransferase